MENEEARGEFWPDAWRIRECRRAAGAEGRGLSSFGPSPRRETFARERRREVKGLEVDEEEGTKRRASRREGERGRRGAASWLQSRRLTDEEENWRSEKTTSYFDGAAVFSNVGSWGLTERVHGNTS